MLDKEIQKNIEKSEGRTLVWLKKTERREHFEAKA